MKNLKKILKKLLPSLAYFYGHLGYRLIILLVTSIFVGLLDGLGIAMFLPLLELVADPNAVASSEKLGNLSFILEILSWTGLSLNLTVVLVTMLIFFVLKGIATYIERLMRVLYQQYFIAKVRLDNVNALVDFSYHEFVKSDAGAIQNTMSGEAERVMQAFHAYSTLLQQMVMVLSYAFLAFLVNPEFSLYVVLGGFLTNLLFNKLYKKTKSISRDLVINNHDFQGYLIQAVAFFKYLKATATLASYAEFMRKMISQLKVNNTKMGKLNSIMMGLREPLMISIVVIIILIEVVVREGHLGSVILSLLFFYRGLTALTAVQTSYNRFLGVSGSLENMSNFLSDLRNKKEVRGNLNFSRFRSQLTLTNLSFAYNNHTLILDDINLNIQRNESVAFVGESGSGKTTLLNIISGLFQPTKGEYRIDNNKMSELNQRTVQARIGYITQDPVIFDDTVFNNVTLWAEKTEEHLQRFKAALKKAHIYEFVFSSQEKENIRLGNNGISLSGGQKQRISIARELYKEVDFIFMDEATSALDSETERNIQRNIDALKGEYTMIIIAHRLSTIKNVDKVVVLNNGKIDMIGSYEEVLKKSESFKQMVKLQEV